jgi:hypothetical protein
MARMTPISETTKPAGSKAIRKAAHIGPLDLPSIREIRVIRGSIG